MQGASMAENENVRLFIGLPVSREAAQALGAYGQTLKDCRVVPEDMYHITLCFLGCRPRQEMDRIARVLEGAPRSALTLTLGQTGAFKNGDILWAGLLHPPRALYDLQVYLAFALDMPEEEYTPHITLARRAKEVAPGVWLPPVRFSPPEIILYESLREEGILRYRPRFRVPLL